jgi:hypothetical protein
MKKLIGFLVLGAALSFSAEWVDDDFSGGECDGVEIKGEVQRHTCNYN